VTDSTGNFFENQTDLSIGGRGVGLALTRTYNSQDGAKGLHGPFGYGWSSSFGDHLALDKEHKSATLYQGNGSTVPFTEADDGSFTPPAWTQDSLSGNPASGYTLTRSNQIRYHFAANGRLESVTDRNGNTTTLSYDGSGRLETITDPAGRKITLAYTAEGLVESATDPMGHVVKYTYENGDLASVTEPGEASPRWQFHYDGSHQMTSMTDGRGGTSTNVYEGSHRVSSQTDPAGRTVSLQYLPQETKSTDATGSVTDEKFNDQLEPSSITCGVGTPDATSRSFSYDSQGNLTSAADGNGHATKYTYDSAANRTAIVDADGNESKWSYNGTHDVILTTTPNGEVTTIARDSHGNAESISRPAPGGQTQTTRYAYDPYGELTSVTDPLGRISTYGYDAPGDRTSATDPEGDKRTWAYDADSRITSMVSPRGNATGAKSSSFTTTTERDAQGRTVAVTDPLKHTTKYSYDPNGNLASTTDPNGHVTSYAYDADDERTKVTEPTGIVTETGYDGAGRVISQTDGNKHTTSYVRNAIGRVSEVTDPLGRKTTKEYDLAENLKRVKDPAERTTSYTYDPANRLQQISVGNSSIAKYAYDADGNRTRMADASGETSYAYDQLDRLTDSKDGHGDVVKYGYDLANQQTSTTYPNGKAVSRDYDKSGRLQKVTDWSGNATQFSYDADSDLTATIFPPSTSNKDNYTFDNADQMAAVKMTRGSGELVSLLYTRDKDGQLTATSSNGVPGEEEKTDSYDENSRLTREGVTAYQYDAANNPIKIAQTSYAYDGANQLISGTGVKYTYDQLGERTRRTPTRGPVTSYGYDTVGNLISVTRPTAPGTPPINDTYVYNGDGLRTAQAIGGTTSNLTWDNSTVPLLLTDEKNSYVYGPNGLPVEQINAAGEIVYLHHDQQGSTRMLTSSTGASKRRITYDAYGNVIGSTGTQTTPLGYNGQYTSADTGLIYLRARVYDPQTAQFLTRDPIEAISRAPYGYAKSNPTSNQDNTGLLFGGIGAAIGGFLEEHETVLTGLEGLSNFGAGFANDRWNKLLDAVGENDPALNWLIDRLNLRHGLGVPFCGPGLGVSYGLGQLSSHLWSLIDEGGGLEEASGAPVAPVE
jgi:RHS repeat-associated protein